MPATVTGDPLGIVCVFSDGSRAEFSFEASANPRLARDLLAGLVELSTHTGLIQLDLGTLVPDGVELRRSHTNHNTETRAQTWSQTNPQSGDPERWDWPLVTQASSKLNRLIRRLAARKIGPWPVLPQASQLITDEALR